MKATTFGWASLFAMFTTAAGVYALTPSGGFAEAKAEPEQLDRARFDVDGFVDSLASPPQGTATPTASPTSEPLAFAPAATTVPRDEHPRPFLLPEKKPAFPVPVSKAAPKPPGPPGWRSRQVSNDLQAPPPAQPRVFAAPPPQAFMPVTTSFRTSSPPPQMAPPPMPSGTASSFKR